MGQGASSLMGSTTGMTGSASDQTLGAIAGSSDMSNSTQSTPIAPGAEPPMKGNLDIMQKFTNLLGKDPKEREKNAKVFAALVKDLGNVGKSITDSTLMQRMMTEQMGGGMQMLGEGAGGSPVGPIPRQDFSQPIMPSGGFR